MGGLQLRQQGASPAAHRHTSALLIPPARGPDRRGPGHFMCRWMCGRRGRIGWATDVVMAHRDPSNPTPTTSQPPEAPVWLSVEQIRKRERMRRERVIEAMEAGDLPYERRGRIRYARLSDIIAWEERRLNIAEPKIRKIRSDLHDLL